MTLINLAPMIIYAKVKKVNSWVIRDSRNKLNATSMSLGLKTDALISGFKLSSANLMIELCSNGKKKDIKQYINKNLEFRAPIAVLNFTQYA